MENQKMIQSKFTQGFKIFKILDHCEDKDCKKIIVQNMFLEIWTMKKIFRFGVFSIIFALDELEG